jgi:hypothetical protein
MVAGVVRVKDRKVLEFFICLEIVMHVALDLEYTLYRALELCATPLSSILPSVPHHTPYTS